MIPTYRLSKTNLTTALLSSSIALGILAFCKAPWYSYAILVAALFDALVLWKGILDFSVDPSTETCAIRYSLVKPRLLAPLNSLQEIRLLTPGSFFLKGVSVLGFFALELIFKDGRRLQSGFVAGFPWWPYREDVKHFYRDARRYFQEKQQDPSAHWKITLPSDHYSRIDRTVLTYKLVGRTAVAFGVIAAVALTAAPLFILMKNVLPSNIIFLSIVVLSLGYCSTVAWLGWVLVFGPMTSANHSFLAELQQDIPA